MLPGQTLCVHVFCVRDSEEGGVCEGGAAGRCWYQKEIKIVTLSPCNLPDGINLFYQRFYFSFVGFDPVSPSSSLTVPNRGFSPRGGGGERN